MLHKRDIIAERQIRELIRGFLLEDINESLLALLALGSDSSDSPQDVIKRKPGLGNKFSYENEGNPEGVIVAITPNKKSIAKIYIKASNRSPVESGMGSFISSRDLNAFDEWDWVDDPRFKKVFNDVDGIVHDIQLNNEKKSEKIYKDLGVFEVNLDLIKKPKLESTEAGQLASTQGGCALDWDGFKERLVYLFDPSQKKKFEESLLLVADCIKSKTVDSVAYAVAQAVLMFIPVAGPAIEAVMDAVPGILLAAAYLQLGMKQTAYQIILMTLVFVFTPTIVSKSGLKSWKAFLANAIPAATVALFSTKLTRWMFGEDRGFSESEWKSFLDSKEDGSLEDFRSNNASAWKRLNDPGSLKAQWPVL